MIKSICSFRVASILALLSAAHAVPLTVEQSMTVTQQIRASGGPAHGALGPGFTYQLANPVYGLICGVLFEIRLSGDVTSSNYNIWTEGTYVMPYPENVGLDTYVIWLPAMNGTSSFDFRVPVVATTHGVTEMLQPGESHTFHDQFAPVSCLYSLPVQPFVGSGSSGFIFDYSARAPHYGDLTANVTMTTSLTYIYGAPDETSTAWLLIGSLLVGWGLQRTTRRQLVAW